MTQHRTPATRRRLRPLVAAGALAALPVALVACGDDESATSTTTSTPASSTTAPTAAATAPTVTDAWVRAASAGGNSAAYMVISAGASGDALVSAAVPEGLAGEVQLHETTTGGTEGSDGMDGMDGMDGSDGSGGMDGMDGMDGDGSSGMMSMRQVTEIPVPADGSVALEPGGYHVMLLDLKQDLTAGQTVPVTLTFSSGATTTVDAEVRAG